MILPLLLVTFYACPGSSVTTEKLMEVLGGLEEQWYGLGSLLDIPYSKRSEFGDMYIPAQ